MTGRAKPVPPALVAILREVLGDPTLEVARASWADSIPNWDSFKLVEIFLECQRAFGISLSPDEMDEVGSVGDIADLLERHAARLEEARGS